jgi:uncharacterized protein YjbI with pentapeptide repeats
MRKSVLAAVPLLFLTALTGCQRGATMWGACDGSDPTGTDGTYVLICKGGTWEPIMTVKEFAANRSGKLTPIAPLPTRPTTTTTAAPTTAAPTTAAPATTTTVAETTTTTTIPPVDCGVTPAPNVDLHGCDLTGRSFVEQDLSGINLSGANLTDTSFSAVYLGGADLSGANLSGASIFDSSLNGADLHDALVDGSLITSTSLRSANLRGIHGTEASISNTDSSDADFTDAHLSQVTYSAIGVGGANFSHANITGSMFYTEMGYREFGDNFTGATLNVTFSGNFDNSNFTAADLYGSWGNTATFVNSIWSQTTCPNGDLSDTPCNMVVVF